MYHKQNIVIIFLLVLIAGIAGLLFSHNNAQPTSVLGDETQQTTKKTLTNTRYGYTLSYPSDFIVAQETDNLTWLYSKHGRFDFLGSPKVTEGEPRSGVQIQIRSNAEGLSLSDWLASQNGFPEFETKELALISGTTAYQATTAVGGWKARQTYFVQMSKAVMQISFYANNDALVREMTPAFDSILNSLSLPVEAAQAVSNETYQNGIYGFVIDYPSDAAISYEDYDKGNASFTTSKKDLTVDVIFGAERTKFLNVDQFIKSREESKFLENTKNSKVAEFESITGTLTADTNNSYHFVSTSRGYFLIRVKQSKTISQESQKSAEEMLASFRVYELLDTSTWKQYASTDGVFRFMYPKEASIKNLHNGVELQVNDVTIGLYVYENFDLPILEWIDNRQLNKYKGADSRHFSFSAKSRVDYKEALRVVDPVSDIKLTAYVRDPKKMYVIDMKPFDAKNKTNLALFNTILETVDLN